MCLCLKKCKWQRNVHPLVFSCISVAGSFLRDIFEHSPVTNSCWSACIKKNFPLRLLYTPSDDEPVKSKRKTMALYQTASNAGSTQNGSISIFCLCSVWRDTWVPCQMKLYFIVAKSPEDEWQTCHIRKENQKVLNVSLKVTKPTSLQEKREKKSNLVGPSLSGGSTWSLQLSSGDLWEFVFHLFSFWFACGSSLMQDFY